MVDPKRSALMKRVRQHSTAPEQDVRALLTKLGARYRVNVKDLPGRPDIANKTLKKALFVHGCFWHAHQYCAKHRLPKNNREFWSTKFAANIERDARKTDLLRAQGFDVLVVWQCEIEEPDALAERLREFWWGTQSPSAQRPLTQPVASGH